MKRISKRISKVTIKRLADESPDTSYLGEYSNTATSEFSIDREHSLDCSINTGDTPIENKTRKVSDIAKSRCECSDSKCPTACDGKCQMAASYLFFRTDMEDLSGTMFCAGCGDDAYESGNYVMADDDSLTEPECNCSGGDIERNEYQYFNPGTVEPFNKDAEWMRAIPEADKQEHWRAAMRENAVKDYERMESLNRGNWCYIGIRAEAEIAISNEPHKRTNTTWTLQEISSGGLWGIESDSDKSYLAEIETEQLSELRSQLRALGFGTRAIATAFKNVIDAR
jgi:hypothetical protein